jgi:hypothetical protein
VRIKRLFDARGERRLSPAEHLTVAARVSVVGAHGHAPHTT